MAIYSLIGRRTIEARAGQVIFLPRDHEYTVLSPAGAVLSIQLATESPESWPAASAPASVLDYLHADIVRVGRDDHRRLVRAADAALSSADGEQGRALVCTIAHRWLEAQGHYQTLGQINGGTVQFLVDTGATTIAMSSTRARQLGLNYLKGERGYTQTASGKAAAYRITLDTVKVGDITLHNVDAVVLEGDALPVVLLGMSFLSRTEMKRDGQSLILVKRF